MADLPSDQELAGNTGDATDAEPSREQAPGMPRWVKIAGVVAVVVVLLLFAVLVFGGGQHGPSIHMPAGGQTPTGGAPSESGHGSASPVAEGAFEIDVTADNFTFEPNEITVAAGTDLAIVLTSVDMLHDFTIDELDAHVAAERGETATGGFRAHQPGRYTYYCAEPGHREAGMEGTLVVQAAGHHP